jgi:hypothetical protein
MTDREAMKQALEALNWASDQIEPEAGLICQCPLCQSIYVLESLLARPEREACAQAARSGGGEG